MIRRKDVDQLSGRKFELFTGHLLSQLQFRRVTVTKPSRDHGLDVIAHTMSDKSIGIQCKHVSKHHKINYDAVEQAYAGRGYYHTDVGIVLTNGTFTKDALRGAKKLHIICWDVHNLQTLIDIANDLDAYATLLPKMPHKKHLSTTELGVLNLLMHRLATDPRSSNGSLTLYRSDINWICNILHIDDQKLLAIVSYFQHSLLVRHQKYDGHNHFELAFLESQSSFDPNSHHFTMIRLIYNKQLIKVILKTPNYDQFLKHDLRLLNPKENTSKYDVSLG